MIEDCIIRGSVLISLIFASIILLVDCFIEGFSIIGKSGLIVQISTTLAGFELASTSILSSLKGKWLFVPLSHSGYFENFVNLTTIAIFSFILTSLAIVFFEQNNVACAVELFLFCLGSFCSLFQIWIVRRFALVATSDG